MIEHHTHAYWSACPAVEAGQADVCPQTTRYGPTPTPASTPHAVLTAGR